MNYREVGTTMFPAPRGININMMPYIMGEPSSVPEEYRGYLPIISMCDIPEDERGKTGYITITESLVSAGRSQRRPGPHTERHGKDRGWGGGWGGLSGGLYIASSLGGSTRIWDTLILEPGEGGDLSQIESELKRVPSDVMKENTLYWLTDATPHEALVQETSTYRQFFRLVTSEVDIWYRDHSTENRLGVAPDARILNGSKF